MEEGGKVLSLSLKLTGVRAGKVVGLRQGTASQGLDEGNSSQMSLRSKKVFTGPTVFPLRNGRHYSTGLLVILPGMLEWGVEQPHRS